MNTPENNPGLHERVDSESEEEQRRLKELEQDVVAARIAGAYNPLEGEQDGR